MDDDRYVAHVWSIETGKIARRRRFKTLAGALRFGEREVAGGGVREVTITDHAGRPGVGPRVARVDRAGIHHREES